MSMANNNVPSFRIPKVPEQHKTCSRKDEAGKNVNSGKSILIDNQKIACKAENIQNGVNQIRRECDQLSGAMSLVDAQLKMGFSAITTSNKNKISGTLKRINEKQAFAKSMLQDARSRE